MTVAAFLTCANDLAKIRYMYVFQSLSLLLCKHHAGLLNANSGASCLSTSTGVIKTISRTFASFIFDECER